MRPRPPAVQNSIYPAEVEIVVGLSERDPELRPELGQLIRGGFSQGRTDSWTVPLHTHIVRHRTKVPLVVTGAGRDAHHESPERS